MSFIPHGLCAKVREWLADLERDEARLESALQALEAEVARPLLRVHPGKVASYLANLRATLAKGGTRARGVVQEDIEKVIVHPARSETAKPFARAEVIASGKGLLEQCSTCGCGVLHGARGILDLPCLMQTSDPSKALVTSPVLVSVHEPARP
jgi:hypothetical protein